MRLAPFELLVPASLDEAFEALARGGVPIAGGTDLLPTLKQRRWRPERLVSLHRLAVLQAEHVEGEGLVLGALRSLAEVASSPLVAEHAPMVAQAAAAGASPQLREMGTLGGNLNLDPRCRYVNQSQFWRGALGGCLKSEGDVCHVVPSGKRCVAAMSSDLAPALIALDASVTLASMRGARTLRLDDYYRADGTANTTRAPDELLIAVRVPFATGPRRTTYVKWRPRKSIDFPLVALAIRVDLAEAGVSRVCVVANVLGAKPKVVGRLDRFAGRALDAALAAEVAEVVFEQCKPLPNVPWDPAHRRELHRVLTRRALEELARR
ncbi:MAG: FAD binding domain-containing protein [Myxococcales bacterium]|nr:FAD binding domain-containing protein [Myxococcales bacterium]